MDWRCADCSSFSSRVFWLFGAWPCFPILGSVGAFEDLVSDLLAPWVRSSPPEMARSVAAQGDAVMSSRERFVLKIMLVSFQVGTSTGILCLSVSFLLESRNKKKKMCCPSCPYCIVPLSLEVTYLSSYDKFIFSFSIFSPTFVSVSNTMIVLFLQAGLLFWFNPVFSQFSHLWIVLAAAEVLSRLISRLPVTA